MEKKEITTLISLGILAVVISFISASGVASPYWPQNPLKLAPGESTTIALALQNMVGGENITVNASISSEGNIATITENSSQYFVPLGSDNVPVNIYIQLPKNAQIGKTYDINVLFNEISSGQGGMLHVASAFSTTIPVEVVNNSESLLYKSSNTNSTLLYVIIGLIIVVGILLLIARRKKKR